MSPTLLYRMAVPGSGGEAVSHLSFSGGPRIPREDFQALQLADNVLREAQAAADRLRADTAAMLEAQKRQAHAEGFAQGRAEATTAVLGALEAERRLCELLSHRLADVVEHCLRGILGEMGERELIRHRILHLLRTGLSSSMPSRGNGAANERAHTGSVATLYVSPELLVQAQEIVADLRLCQGNVPGLAVVPDERRSRDSLLLEIHCGFVETDMTVTLRQAREMVQRALHRALGVLGESQ